MPILRSLVCVVLLGSTAHAETASQLLADGISRYDQAEFKTSLRVLERARKLTDKPVLRGRIQLYIGLNHAVLGSTDRARTAMAASLTDNPTLHLDPKLFKKELVRLLEEVRAGLKGALTVTADGPGATAVIDGGEPQPLPCRRKLVIGEHSVVVRGPDGKTVHSVKVTLTAGGLATVEAKFPRTVVGLAPGPTTAPTTPLPSDEPSFWKRRRIWTWVVLGLAVASAGAAIGVGVASNNKIDGCFWNQDPKHVPPCVDEVTTLENATNAMWGVAGGLAAISVVLLFLEGRPSASNKAALRLTPLLGTTTGALLTTTF
jgi:hypothetical protein